MALEDLIRPAYTATRSAPSVMSEQEQNAQMRSLFGAPLTLIGGIGSALDTYSGASSIRDVLAGENPFDQLIAPFDESKKVTGREMGRRLGLFGDDDNWGNFGAGLALEIGLDPATYATFGASAAGKLGKAGKFLNRPELLQSLGKGKATLRVAGGGDDLLKMAGKADSLMPDPLKKISKSNLQQLDENAANILGWKDYLHTSVTSELGGKMKSGKAIEALRKLEGDRLGSSMKFAGRPIGVGAKAQRVAKFTDDLASKIKEAPVISSLVKGAQYTFDPEIQGITTKLGGLMSRLSRNSNAQTVAALRATTRNLLEERKMFKDAAGNVMNDDGYLQVMEVVNDVFDDTKNAINASELIPEAMKPFVHAHQEKVAGHFNDLVEHGHLIGDDVSEFASDAMLSAGDMFSQRYFPHASEIARMKSPTNQRLAKLFSTADPHNTRRIQAFRGSREGLALHRTMLDNKTDLSRETNRLVNNIEAAMKEAGDSTGKTVRVPPRMAKRPTLEGIEQLRLGEETLEDVAEEITPSGRVQAAKDEFTKHMEKHYGAGTLKDPWRIRQPTFVTDEGKEALMPWVSRRERIVRKYVTEVDGKQVVGDRYDDLAEVLSLYSEPERVAGIFSNDPLIDMENRLIRGWESQNVGKVSLSLFAHHALDAGDHGEKGISIKKVLRERNIGLREGNHENGAVSELWRIFSGDELNKLRPPATADELAENIKIPDKVAAKAAKMQPEEAEAFLGKYVQKESAKAAKKVNDTIQDWILDLHVPRELVEGLERVRGAHGPPNPNKFIEAVDSYSAWFKAVNTVINSVPPLSAFAMRNFYAGQFANFATGNFSLKALRDSWDFWAGKNVQGVAQWPSVRRALIDRTEQLPIPDNITKAGADRVKQFRADRVKKALDGLNDETGTKLLEDLAYTHNVFGPNLGSIGAGPELSHLRPEQVSEAIPQQMPVREVMPGATRGAQALEMTKRTYRQAAALEPGLTMNPTAFRGVGGRQETRFGMGVAGEGVNGLVESTNRGVPFFHQLSKGIDPAEAASKANALQVDYSWRNYTDVERDYLTRLFPFYKWTRKMLPFTLKEIMQKPGGTIGKAIRIQDRLAGGGEGQYVPERLAQGGVAIPLGQQDPEGNRYWLSQIDLPHEGATQPFKLGPSGQGVLPFIGGTISGTARGLMGSMHPIPKAAIETATGTRLFDGRDLQRLDGGMKRIYSNVGDIIASITGKEVPDIPLEKFKAGGLENVLWGMIGGPASKFRTLTDWRELRKGPVGIGKIGVNLGTGARITNINEQRIREIEAQQKLLEILRGKPGLREFTKPYIRKDELELVSPEDRGYLELLNALRAKPPGQ